MRFTWAVFCCCSLLACKKDEPKPAPLAPGEISVAGAYHAIACGPVTAVWSGKADALRDLPQPAPKSFGVESLSFRFADGSSKGFAPTGQVFFSDWRFDIFSPDCAQVALQIDHYGPYHLVKTADLRAYLEGRAKPKEALALNGKDAMVHSDGRWLSPDTFEFVASCCGGAQVFQTKGDELKKVFDAPVAPRGLKRVSAGYEVVP